MFIVGANQKVLKIIGSKTGKLGLSQLCWWICLFECPLFQDVNIDTLKSTWSDGYLVIEAEVKAAKNQPKKTIEIKIQKDSEKDYI